jgi:hypothetical protein
MKKLLFSLVLTMLMSHLGLCQDLITYKNGKEVNGKVTEITRAEIKFKHADNPDGPVYTALKSEIHSIAYANGQQEVFEDETQKANASTSSIKQQAIIDDRLKFSGPRIGLTVIGSGWAADKLRDRGKTPVVTQFGWQFETRIFTLHDGTTGLFEFVPAIGGLEQGMFLPSFNALIGIRGKKGAEFAFGPNLSLTGAGLVIALGSSFHTENVYFPINIALIPSVNQQRYTSRWEPSTQSYVEVKERTRTGARVSLLIGFMTRKR